MVLNDASQQALLKTCTKDSFYINILRNQVHGLCQNVLGDQIWIIWQKEIEVIADFVYFFLTTVRGSQTLGEEYVCTIQVDATKRKIPSKLQRLLQVLLHCTSPYCIEKLLLHFEHNTLQLKGLASSHKIKLLVLFRFLFKIIPVFHHAHLILFYIQGVYANLSKRIAGVKHILIRPRDETEHDAGTFRWLAILGGTQIFCKLISLILEARKEVLNKKETELSTVEFTSDSSAVEETETNKCMLCLDVVRDITTTVCGHMFCWKCIIDWCTVKSECPACREICPPSRVVRLYNYYPT